MMMMKITKFFKKVLMEKHQGDIKRKTQMVKVKAKMVKKMNTLMKK
jgi:hypothetical protein